MKNCIRWQVLLDRGKFIRTAFALPLVMALLSSLYLTETSIQAAERGKSWKSGPSFQLQLQAPITVTFSGTKLRSTLRKISEVQQTASFLDRRVDPSIEVRFTASQLSLWELYSQIAAQHSLRTTMLKSVIYVGPKDSAIHLQTTAALARQQIEKLSLKKRKRLLQVHPWHSLALSTPRNMLTWLAKEADVTITNLNELPHDLWPEIDLPPLIWSDRVTLLLIGFDKTFELDNQGRTMSIVPLDKSRRLTIRYPVGQQSTARAELLAKRLPKAKIHTDGNELVITGTAEEQRKVSQILSGNAPRNGRPTGTKKQQQKGLQVYTLRIANQPLEPVLRSLAKQLRKPLEFDSDMAKRAGIDLEQLVTCEVKEASLQKLLDAIVANTGLVASVSNGKIVVSTEK